MRPVFRLFMRFLMIWRYRFVHCVPVRISPVAVKSLEQTRMADLIPGDNRALQRSCLRPSAILTFHSIGSPEEAAPYRRLAKSEDPLQL